jgi:hypothetical protein
LRTFDFLAKLDLFEDDLVLTLQVTALDAILKIHCEPPGSDAVTGKFRDVG